MAAAHKRYAIWVLGGVSFAESSFFPVPPDVMLIPMALARPERAWVYATVCTVTSVLGGIVGYGIGALLYNSVGSWLIQLYGHGQGVETFRQLFVEHGGWVIVGKGITPIPYKLVTITSGFAGYDIWWFIGLSILTRGGRFFFIAVVLNRFGDWIRAEIDRNFGLWVAIAAVVFVLGFIVVAWLL